VWRFDVFRELHDGDTWICRRDASIRRPYAEVFEVSADGIPYLKHEICLLFKAKAVRDKDRADFETALPRMSLAQRMWLHAALERGVSRSRLDFRYRMHGVGQGLIHPFQDQPRSFHVRPRCENDPSAIHRMHPGRRAQTACTYAVATLQRDSPVC
jgi:hypothetical protein